MNKEMNPELKKAFRATIERWEKIVDDVTYYARSGCDLCNYADKNSSCDMCPIYIKTRTTGCEGTPWDDFTNLGGQTTENALRELVFLKNLYIELIDCPKPLDEWDKLTKKERKRLEEAQKVINELVPEKRAKKEEWVDITKEIEWKLVSRREGYWRLTAFYEGKEIGFMNNKAGYICTEDYDIYKTEIHSSSMYFKILKKETTWK